LLSLSRKFISLGLEPASTDLVVLSVPSSFHRLSVDVDSDQLKFQKLLEFFRDCFRVLKPNGKLVTLNLETNVGPPLSLLRCLLVVSVSVVSSFTV
jgi:hypothetical protein